MTETVAIVSLQVVHLTATNCTADATANIEEKLESITQVQKVEVGFWSVEKGEGRCCPHPLKFAQNYDRKS